MNDSDQRMRYVSKAPTRDGELVPIHVTAMTLRHVRWWSEYVQPWINVDPNPRADKGWRWLRIFATTYMIGGMLRQQPIGLVAGVLRDRQILPVCMALLVERYPYLPEQELESVFLWYATRCPDTVIQRALNLDPESVPKRLMEITVDLAVTTSFRAGLAGRAALHAAKEGGEELCRKYEMFGMQRLPPQQQLPLGFRRSTGNDGRYFYHSEETALLASAQLDPYR